MHKYNQNSTSGRTKRGRKQSAIYNVTAIEKVKKQTVQRAQQDWEFNPV